MIEMARQYGLWSIDTRNAEFDGADKLDEVYIGLAAPWKKTRGKLGPDYAFIARHLLKPDMPASAKEKLIEQMNKGIIRVEPMGRYDHKTEIWGLQLPENINYQGGMETLRHQVAASSVDQGTGCILARRNLQFLYDYIFPDVLNQSEPMTERYIRDLAGFFSNPANLRKPENIERASKYPMDWYLEQLKTWGEAPAEQILAVHMEKIQGITPRSKRKRVPDDEPPSA